VGDAKAYIPVKASRTARYDVRGLSYSVRAWGSNDAPPLVLLHGIRDASASFQFLVDALRREWYVIAPDWRGHGGSAASAHQSWFHDYLADLDLILETLLPDQAVRLVGHSMGGNVASVFAGLRPERVSHLISIDAFGLLAPSEDGFSHLLAHWLKTGRAPRLPKCYRELRHMAEKLCTANPRLSQDKALFLANNLSRRIAGGLTWQFEGVDRRSMPTLHALGEWAACWRGITARRLWIAATEIRPGSLASDPDSFAYVVNQIGSDSMVTVPNTGHNMHHDAPDEIARIIERFVCGEEVAGELAPGHGPISSRQEEAS
jgi:pimeloyl-ACP methyl ester carboxylesterase